MKTMDANNFDAVKYMREQRKRLTEKLSKKTKQEIVEYFKKRRTEATTKPSS
jgi:hypothetical protein